MKYTVPLIEAPAIILVGHEGLGNISNHSAVSVKSREEIVGHVS